MVSQKNKLLGIILKTKQNHCLLLRIYIFDELHELHELL